MNAKQIAERLRLLATELTMLLPGDKENAIAAATGLTSPTQQQRT